MLFGASDCDISRLIISIANDYQKSIIDWFAFVKWRSVAIIDETEYEVSTDWWRR